MADGTTIRVLTTEGVKQLPAAEATFHEHELAIDHWEAVFRHVARPGGPKDDGTGEWLEERLAMLQRARDRLYSGDVPYKGKPDDGPQD